MTPHSANNTRCLALLAAALMMAGPVFGDDNPDHIIFKNGRQLQGLVVQSDSTSITLQHSGRVEKYERSDIRRVDDTATTCAYFAAATQTLPPWRALVNDLRSNETVHQLEYVSAGRETEGPFARVPFVAFVMNGSVDLRIYGDPENPAGILIRLRGGKAGDAAEQKAIRSFFAGFLTNRAQIAALYKVDMKGGQGSGAELEISVDRHRSSSQAQWCMAVWVPSQVAQLRGRPFNYGLDTGWQDGFLRDRNGRIRMLRGNPPSLASRD